MLERRFRPPWSVDDPDMKLGQTCYIVRDANGHALAYVYFEEEPRTKISGAAMATVTLPLQPNNIVSDYGRGVHRPLR
jgi:hypothetical protein